MCRYAEHEARTHFVCVPCRTSIKALSAAGGAPRCPRCRAEMADAGRDLAVPRRRDARGWRALAAVLAAGLDFDSCGCAGPGFRPRTPAAVRARTRFAVRAGRPVEAALAERNGVY